MLYQQNWKKKIKFYTILFQKMRIKDLKHDFLSFKFLHFPT